MELIEKLINVTRCTKVTKGGRNFRFSVTVVIGDKKGRIGYGLGKAAEVLEAKLKALEKAKKNLRKIFLKGGRTLYYDVMGKYCSGKVIIKPASVGKGIIAGGPLRAVFTVLGIKDIIAKSIGSRNSHNMVKATLNGLYQIKKPKIISEKKIKVNKITNMIK